MRFLDSDLTICCSKCERALIRSIYPNMSTDCSKSTQISKFHKNSLALILSFELIWSYICDPLLGSSSRINGYTLAELQKSNWNNVDIKIIQISNVLELVQTRLFPLWVKVFPTFTRLESPTRLPQVDDIGSLVKK